MQHLASIWHLSCRLGVRGVSTTTLDEQEEIDAEA